MSNSSRYGKLHSIPGARWDLSFVRDFRFDGLRFDDGYSLGGSGDVLRSLGVHEVDVVSGLPVRGHGGLVLYLRSRSSFDIRLLLVFSSGTPHLAGTLSDRSDLGAVSQLGDDLLPLGFEEAEVSSRCLLRP